MRTVMSVSRGGELRAYRGQRLRAIALNRVVGDKAKAGRRVYADQGKWGGITAGFGANCASCSEYSKRDPIDLSGLGTDDRSMERAGKSKRFDFAPGRRIAGKYDIERLLGSGWEGEVY